MSTRFEFQGLVKADAEKRQLHGTIYRSDKIDSQGEFMSAAELTKAAHAALANGVKIDVGHDGKALAKQHAALVESSVVDEDGGKVWRGIVQLSEQAWAQLVKTGKVAAFSIGGQAPRRAVQKDGKSVREIHDAVVEFVSLVAKGAIGEPVVAKSDEPKYMADVRALIAKTEALVEQVAELRAARLGKSSSSTPTVADIRKAAMTEAAVRAEVELNDLRAQHLAKSNALASIWEGHMLPGESRVQSEQRLCRDLAQIEERMESLGKSVSVDLTDPSRSAFTFRGGESTTLRAKLPTDSGWLSPTNKVSKSREDAVNLNPLYM